MTREERYSADAPERHRSWDERFAGEDFAYGTEPSAFLTEVADRIPRGRVLSLGEGEGRNAVYLAERGYIVTGIDSSSVGLAKAKRLAESRGVVIETIHTDLDAYSIEPEAWEGIVSIWVHLPPPLRARLHREAVRGLVPGGVLILQAYTPAQLEYGTGGPPVRELLMDLATLREELQGLDLVIGREIVRDVHEGRLHHGPSAVVQVVAVKPA